MNTDKPETSAGRSSGKKGGIGDGEPGAAAAATTVEANEALEDDGDLVFRWRANRGRIFALFFFVGVALLVHAVGFYLFQVTPTISARVEAKPARVTLLDPADPTTAAILREVDDRLVFLRPASLGTGSRLRIEDYSVDFRPSFMQRRVPFRRPVVSGLSAEPLQELLPPDGLVLPPVARLPGTELPTASTPLGEAEPAEPAESRWKITGDLEARALTEAAFDSFDAALPELSSGPGVRLQIWVDAAGRVVNVLPLSGTEQPLIGEITKLLRANLRFVPRPGVPLESGKVSVD